MARHLLLIQGSQVVVSNTAGDSVTIAATPEGLVVEATDGRVTDATRKLTSPNAEGMARTAS